MTQIPAGWYPDPAPTAPGQSPSQRYWDGQTWTEHVFPGPTYAPAYAAATRPGPTTPDGVPLAGWWQRVGAYLLDGLIVGVVSSLVTLPLQLRMQDDLNALLDRYTAVGPNQTFDTGQFFRDYLDLLGPVLTWSALISFGLWAVYNAVFLRTKGATPGKMALGLAVRLRERPGRLPWSAIALRVLVQHGVALLAVVPLLYLAVSWFPMLDALWASWDGKRQALHDKAARTNVIRTR
jgi:uncharacterized RDD family membrane protein YckC